MRLGRSRLYRHRRRFLAAGVAAGLLLWGAIAAAAQVADESADIPSPAPSRFDNADSRMAAALSDQQSETDRVARASEAFDAALNDAPDIDSDYLVSLDAAIPSDTLIEATDKVGIQLDTVYIWLLAKGSLFPIVGQISLSSDGEDQQLSLSDRVTSYLKGRVDELRTEAESPSEDPTSAAALRAQADELETLLASVEAAGAAPLYGFTCKCSPQDILSLSEVLPTGKVRAVEAADGALVPVPVVDPMRDQIIAKWRNRWYIGPGGSASHERWLLWSSS